jgi:periplasmic protein TonB
MHSMSGSIIVPRVSLRFVVVAAAHVGLFYIVADALRFELKPEVDRTAEVTFLPVKPRPAPQKLQPVPPSKGITVRPIDPPAPLDIETAELIPVPDPGQWEQTGVDATVIGAVIERFVPVRANPNQPLTRASYPAASIRLEEEGVVELAIYVLRDGRIAEVKVSQSSGYPRLDRAAVEEARRQWRLQPATRGVEAIDAWGSFRVVFRLDRR